jgi:hypothetical protein
MTFSNPANGWITGHLTQGVDSVRDQQDADTDTCGGQCCLSSSMAATDNNDVVMLRVSNHAAHTLKKKGGRV